MDFLIRIPYCTVALVGATILLLCYSGICCNAISSDEVETRGISQKTSIASGSKIVSISQGKVEGIILISRWGNEYLGFRGIPYAKVSKRFGPPEPADEWDGVLPAHEIASPCSQFSVKEHRVIGVENCLTLDVYTPKLDGNLPVVVFIHGGGFQTGSGISYGAKYFADESAILVSLNYRLGALGFLNTGDDGLVSGNMGLRDQVKALEWVNLNIKNFGGDPSRVLVFGNGAGGAATNYHMLSPLSKGLFSAAYSQSGTALSPFAFQRHPRENALRLAEYLECTTADSAEMVECLRGKSAREILKAQMKFRKLPREFDVMNMIFTPSVETAGGSEAFLLDTPYSLMANDRVESRVPWMVSVARDEGLFWTSPYLGKTELVRKLNEKWDTLSPQIFFLDEELRHEDQNNIKLPHLIKDFYLKDSDGIKSTLRKQLSDIYADRYIVNGVLESISLYQQERLSGFPIYTALFNFTGISSIVEDFFMVKSLYGTTHSDDLQYLFNQSHSSPEYEAGTRIGDFSEKLVRLIVSFADNGKPSATWGSQLKWDPISTSADGNDLMMMMNIRWYEINKETSLIDNTIFKERFQFWKSLPVDSERKQLDPPEKSVPIEHSEL